MGFDGVECSEDRAASLLDRGANKSTVEVTEHLAYYGKVQMSRLRVIDFSMANGLPCMIVCMSLRAALTHAKSDSANT